jgi:drug/metabolite transporter (DMT)-like permease
MNYLKNVDPFKTAILALIISNIIWGASFPIYKWALQELPVFTFAFIRFFLGALILLPFVLKNIKIDKRDYRDLLILAFFSVTLLIPIQFFGLRLTPSINAPIIFSTGPIILILAAIIFLKEKPSTRVIAGTLISLFGISTIILRPLLDSGVMGSILGNILLFMVTIFSVVQIILLRKLTARNSPMAIIFWTFLIGSVPLFPFVIWEAQGFSLLTDLTSKGLSGIIYGIYFASILAHLFFAYGTKYLKASEVGIFSYLTPLVTIAVAIPLLGESITPAYITGAILVFVGIYIAEGKVHHQPLKKLFTKSQTNIPPPNPIT